MLLLLVVARRLVADQHLQILVEDLRFLVGQILEARESRVQRFFGLQLDAELLQTLLEGVAAGLLAQHQLVGAPAHVLGAHDLVGFAAA